MNDPPSPSASVKSGAATALGSGAVVAGSLGASVAPEAGEVVEFARAAAVVAGPSTVASVAQAVAMTANAAIEMKKRDLTASP